METLPPLEVVVCLLPEELLTLEEGLLTVVPDGRLTLVLPLELLLPEVEYTAEGFGRLTLVLLPDGRLTLVAGRLVPVPVGRTLEGELIPLDGLP